MARRWYFVEVALDTSDPNDPIWRTAAQKYDRLPFGFGVTASDPATGIPVPQWTLITLEAPEQARVVNDLQIYAAPVLDLSKKVSGFTKPSWEVFVSGVESAGVSLEWVTGDHQLRDVLNWLGQQIDPNFDADALTT
ncbi:MAG: hypothetical protein RIR00_867 [Pseudomonadota bacterium]|jgi:hypothetical protein